MLSFHMPSAVRVFLCTQPTDMRKGFDGLMGLVTSVLEQDPLSGHLFLFLNGRRDRLKILVLGPRRLVHLLQAVGSRDV